MNQATYRIAVDGPSGAGKSTIAKAIAKELNIEYIDTGAMYRAIGYKVAKHVDLDGEELDRFLGSGDLIDLLKDTDIDFVNGHIILDGEDVERGIRTPEMSMMASKCSAVPAVREKLVDIQRNMGTRKSVIMDGRDIGTNVLKDAEYKIYLTASPEERANRRYKELRKRGDSQPYEEVLRDIKQRDHNDMTRKLNPLRKADDAVEVDTTGMEIEEVIQTILRMINR